MFLTKYSPARSLDPFWKAFDGEFFPVMRRVFNDDGDDSFRLPQTNINESEKQFVLTMEMPGVARKDVEVSLEDDTLTIEAERSDTVESEGLLRSEIRSGKYRRTFRIGRKIDRDAISARMENGVLTVTLPKSAGVTGRKIDIK